MSNRLASLLRVARLTVAIIVAAAVLHVVEFHLGLGFHGGMQARLMAIIYMIERCPLVGYLGVVGAAFAFCLFTTGWVMFRQLRQLEALDGTGCLHARSRRKRQWRRPSVLARPNPSRLAVYTTVLFVGQTLLFATASAVVPMQYVMEMHGSRMVMGQGEAVPLLPLSLAIALLAGVLLAALETGFDEIAEAIEARVRAAFPVLRSLLFPVRGDWVRPAGAALCGPFPPRPPPPLSLRPV